MKTPGSRKYLEIAESILSDLAHNERLTRTQAQMAASFGVNRQTVRHALDWLEREGKLARVSGRTYGPKVSRNRTKTLKIGFPLWADSLPSLDFNRMANRLTTMQEIHFALTAQGYQLDVQFVGWENNPDLTKIEQLCEEWDAVVLEPKEGESGFLPEHPFYRLRDRAVLIGAIQGEQSNCVCPDLYSAGQLAVEEFVRLGVRRILYSGQRDESIAHRFLRVASIEVAADRHRDLELLYAGGGFHQEETFSAVKKFFLDGGRCDAVLAISSHAAIGTMQALEDMRIRVPEAMQVISIGSSTTAAHLVPKLTCIVTERYRVGQEVARMAIALAQPNASPRPNVLVPMHLVQGRTTAQTGGFHPVAVPTYQPEGSSV